MRERLCLHERKALQGVCLGLFLSANVHLPFTLSEQLPCTNVEEEVPGSLLLI